MWLWTLLVILPWTLVVASPALPPASASSSSPFPRTLMDDEGRQVVIPAPPQRIFSAVAAIDHILLRLVEPERIVAITRFADPRYIGQTHDRIFRMDQLNPEYALALQPDLILAADWNNREALAQIRSLAQAPVYVFAGFDSIEDTLEHIETVGWLTGTEGEAKALVEDIRRRLEVIAERIGDAKRPRVLTYTSWGGTAGAKTINHSVIQHAGGRNVAAEAGLVGWVELSLESLVQMNPDVILASPGDEGRDHQWVQWLLAHPSLQQVTAVRCRQVYAIDHLWSPDHHLVLAVEQLAALLHPQPLSPPSPRSASPLLSAGMGEPASCLGS